MPDNEKSPPRENSSANADSQCQRNNDDVSCTAQINTVIHQITYSGTSDGSEQQKHNSPPIPHLEWISATH